MTSDLLSQAIQEIEDCLPPDPPPAVTKALAVMRALQFLLEELRPAVLEQAPADLDESALVDEEGWPQIRYTLAPEGDRS